MTTNTTNTINDALPTSGIGALPTAMSAAAFLGIAWYLSVELTIRLIFNFTRFSLYFWACLLCCCGIIFHGLTVLLANFDIWTNYGAILIINISWCTFVVSQSFILYSRLNLVLRNLVMERIVLYVILFTATVFGLGTVILNTVARHPTMVRKLGTISLTWDKVQLAVFFTQETLISLIYIRETARHLKNMALLGTDKKKTRRVMRELIYINVVIIALDCSLIGLCYAGFFLLQGFYKIAVYAVKVRIEFAVLNQLRSSLPSASQNMSGNIDVYGTSTGAQRTRRSENIAPPRGSQDSDVHMVVLEAQHKDTTTGITVRRDVEVFSFHAEASSNNEPARK